jgi:hypothetical protein
VKSFVRPSSYADALVTATVHCRFVRPYNLKPVFDSDLVGLEWSGFGGQIHSKAPGAPRTLNLNRNNDYL